MSFGYYVPDTETSSSSWGSGRNIGRFSVAEDTNISTHSISVSMLIEEEGE